MRGVKIWVTKRGKVVEWFIDYQLQRKLMSNNYGND